jgi:hypothetical protein
MELTEITEMFNKLTELKVAYKKAKHELIMEYVQKHAKFKVGDFIGNVTGCIKVDRISYEWEKRWSLFEITYFGKRYRKVKGVYTLCKNQRYNPPFRESNSRIR